MRTIDCCNNEEKYPLEEKIIPIGSKKNSKYTLKKETSQFNLL